MARMDQPLHLGRPRLGLLGRALLPRGVDAVVGERVLELLEREPGVGLDRQRALLGSVARLGEG